MLLTHSIKDADTAHSNVVTHIVGVSSDESCVKMIIDGDCISIIRVGLLALGQKLVRILISH